MGYIYTIGNKKNGKLYIGQTTRPIEERLRQHRKKSSGCSAISAAIQKYGWANFETYWYECPGEDLDEHEELMIEVFETLSPKGYNLKGGGGNGKHSDETKRKIGESHTGKKMSEESRRKIGESLTGEKNHMWGKCHSEESKQQMSESKIGEKNSTSKRVYQYDIDGTFIGSFGSCREAGRHLHKKNGASNISECISGKRKTAYGFKWSYDKKDDLQNIV